MVNCVAKSLGFVSHRCKIANGDCSHLQSCGQSDRRRWSLASLSPSSCQRSGPHISRCWCLEWLRAVRQCREYHGRHGPSRALPETRLCLRWNAAKSCTLLFDSRKRFQLVPMVYAPQCLGSQFLPGGSCFGFSLFCVEICTSSLASRRCTCRRSCSYLGISEELSCLGRILTVVWKLLPALLGHRAGRTRRR